MNNKIFKNGIESYEIADVLTKIRNENKYKGMIFRWDFESKSVYSMEIDVSVHGELLESILNCTIEEYKDIEYNNTNLSEDYKKALNIIDIDSIFEYFVDEFPDEELKYDECETQLDFYIEDKED